MSAYGRIVYLKEADIDEIPEEVMARGDLRKLNIQYNKITRIAPAISQLTSLRVLLASHNRIEVIAPQLYSLTSLTTLNLSNNRLRGLHNNISRMTSLRVIYVQFNVLHSLPPTFGLCSSLEEVRLTKNRLSSLGNCGIEGLTRLQKLTVNSNELTAIPDGVCMLDKLVTLEMAHNKIVAIPDAMSNLVNLRNLDLRDNLIESVPASIGGLTALKLLQLEQNSIAVLAPEVSGLASLELLLLAGNHLVGLPPELGAVPNLHLLDLDLNPLPDDDQKQYQVSRNLGKVDHFLRYLYPARPPASNTGEWKRSMSARDERRYVLAIDSVVHVPDRPWYLLDAQWLFKWHDYTTEASTDRPGLISNHRLLNPTTGRPHSWLKKARHYRAVHRNVYNFFQSVYGGGPAIVRKQIDIHSESLFPLEAREYAAQHTGAELFVALSVVLANELHENPDYASLVDRDASIEYRRDGPVIASDSNESVVMVDGQPVDLNPVVRTQSTRALAAFLYIFDRIPVELQLEVTALLSGSPTWTAPHPMWIEHYEVHTWNVGQVSEANIELRRRKSATSIAVSVIESVYPGGAKTELPLLKKLRKTILKGLAEGLAPDQGLRKDLWRSLTHQIREQQEAAGGASPIHLKGLLIAPIPGVVLREELMADEDAALKAALEASAAEAGVPMSTTPDSEAADDRPASKDCSIQ